jgi:hypothetical protein
MNYTLLISLPSSVFLGDVIIADKWFINDPGFEGVYLAWLR